MSASPPHRQRGVSKGVSTRKWWLLYEGKPGLLFHRWLLRGPLCVLTGEENWRQTRCGELWPRGMLPFRGRFYFQVPKQGGRWVLHVLKSTLEGATLGPPWNAA